MKNPGQKENVMKKLFMLTVVLLVMFAVTAAQAEVRAGSFSITPFAGGYFFEGNENLKDTYTLGLRAGFNLTENVGLEGFLSWIPTELEDYPGNHKENLYGYGLECLIHLFPEGSVVPFVAAGVGGMYYSGNEFEKADKLAVDYGAGVKFFITDNVALRADVRHILPLNDKYNDLLVSLGVNFTFGGHKKVVDSDQDGVFDDVDKCPNTPLGVVVDKDGCPVDSDKDGVPDYLDKCPNTPEGVVVDKDGCPLDSDKDGVPDYLDKCPNTPEGVVVDKDGCPLDSDKDGVPDYLDKCPDTPLGVKVDKDGCPPPPPPPPPPPAPAPKPVIIEKGRQTLNVEFDFDKSTIKKGYYNDINSLVKVMKDYPDLNVVIEGHTDSVGNDAYNKKLSQRRAESVKKYMVENGGIDANRLKAEGFGESKPIASNKTKEGRQQNRRVEAAVDYIIEK